MFIKIASSVFVLGLAVASSLRAGDGPTADEVLLRLTAGNQRFVAGTMTHPHQTVDYRATLAAGQKPFVAVLTCADSRVSPELVFDLGLGDAFVCRVAGNVVDDNGMGSLEYAVEHLHTPIIVVLGHEKCGAVKAAVEGGHAPGHINSLVEKIAPAVEAVRNQPGDLLSNAVRANVQRVVKLLTVSQPILAEQLQAGKVRIVGARYDVATGHVEFFPMTAETVASSPTAHTSPSE